MFSELKSKLLSFMEQALVDQFDPKSLFPSFEIEIPSDKKNGDLSCSLALKSAKIFKKAPIALANEWLPIIEKKLADSALKNTFSKIEVKAPGFINFFISAEALSQNIIKILRERDQYGSINVGKGQKLQIEFVSANPTGPLSVAHARQAAVGDALANILKFIGFDVTKEFYVNDEGNQINILGNSIKLRAMEILGQQVDFPEDCYQGEYIKDMAREFLETNKIKNVEQLKLNYYLVFNKYGVDHLLAVIKKELSDFGVHFDVWSHQSEIATQSEIERVVKFLADHGHTKKEEGALWFLSTKFGDDKDRVIQKSDGNYTYLTPDIVYHQDKFNRGFERIYNIWGPDHHGYIPRIKAAAQALGKDKDSLEVLIIQLATIYKNGEVLSMSTRRGQYISLREVMDEVGVDAARFFFLMRHISAHLEFDLDLAKKQTSENPVFYIQYAHARVFSINKKADESGIKLKEKDLTHLNSEEELDLMKKLGYLSEVFLICEAQKDPCALTGYLLELATSFHRFYDQRKIISTDDLETSSERLTLCNATRIVLSSGLKLLGVSAPESM